MSCFMPVRHRFLTVDPLTVSRPLDTCLQLPSRVFLTFAPFSHFVLTSSLCCAVIKQHVLEGNGLRDQGGGRLPQGEMADTMTPYACIITLSDSSINRKRPPLSTEC